MKYFMKKGDEQDFTEITKNEFIALERKYGIAPPMPLSDKEQALSKKGKLNAYSREKGYVPGQMKPDDKDWLKAPVTSGFGSSIDNVVTKVEV